jgi:hypothetical protein
MDLSVFEKKIFSQNGEDGVTMKLVEMIYTDSKNNSNPGIKNCISSILFFDFTFLLFALYFVFS